MIYTPQKINTLTSSIVVDNTNTTSVALAAGASFIGISKDISNYNQINVEVYARPGVIAGDASSAKATMFFDFSKDGINWDITIPSLVRDPSLFVPVPLINVHRYFRVRYINDGGVIAIAALGLSDVAGTPTLQTVFRLTTYLLPLATKELARTMDQSISGSDPATLVRAGIMGKNPSNTYVNQNTSGVSLSNNTTTPLGSGASFTGVGEDVTGYSSISVNIDSDLVGTMFAQFSQNGLNWTIVPRTFFNTSNGQSYTFAPVAKFFRIMYTNTTGIQSFFRLQTIFKSEAIGIVLAPANTPLSPNTLAQVVVSVPNDGVKTTYTASISNAVPAALTPTDVYVISGSATKTIRVSKVLVSGTRGTPTQTDIVLIKRSTLNTLGTSSVVVAASNDSLNPLPTAVVKSYTANPTALGTSAGLVYSVSLFIPGGLTAAAGGIFQYEFGRLGQTIVLRGVNESLAINLAGVTITGGSLNYTIEWTEE